MITRLLTLSLCLIAAVYSARNPLDLRAAVRCRPRALYQCDNKNALQYYYNAAKDKCQKLPEGFCLFGFGIIWQKGFESMEECEKVCVLCSQSNKPTDEKPANNDSNNTTSNDQNSADNSNYEAQSTPNPGNQDNNNENQEGHGTQDENLYSNSKPLEGSLQTE